MNFEEKMYLTLFGTMSVATSELQIESILLFRNRYDFKSGSLAHCVIDDQERKMGKKRIHS